jgi:hypothetical protein
MAPRFAPFEEWGTMGAASNTEPALRPMRLHVRPEDGIGAGLIDALAAEPAQQVGIEPHGDHFFWRGQHHLGRLPECGVRGVSVGISGDPLRIGPSVRRSGPGFARLDSLRGCPYMIRSRPQ